MTSFFRWFFSLGVVACIAIAIALTKKSLELHNTPAAIFAAVMFTLVAIMCLMGRRMVKLWSYP